MTKKQKVVFAVVAVVIVLGMIMSYAFLMKNQCAMAPSASMR